MSVFCQIRVFILWIILTCTREVISYNRRPQRSFPYNFEFGVTSSAYQTEGAWNIDGKGRSMWDYFVHTKPHKIIDGSTSDDTTKSYYLYKRDIEMLNELGADSYRISIAWSRILPYGHADYINAAGVAFYNNFINELLANGITPYVTIYHWDLPQKLNEQGGWLNERIIDWFGDYARIVFQKFGDRVKNWMTINEPFIHCSFSYEEDKHPPGMKDPGVAYYECGRNILLAHARAYHIYEDEFKNKQYGQVGFVGNLEWGIPASNSTDDIEAALDYNAFHVDHYLHPIFAKEGNYPQRLIDKIAENSAREGRNTSRLRPFTTQELKYIKDTGDFIGVNHYAALYTYRNASLIGRFQVPSLANDKNLTTFYDPSWPWHGWGHDNAPGMYELLIYLKDKYDNPVIYLTENGISTETGLVDDLRVNYFRNYLEATLDAIRDGVDIRGYFPWSLMDNWEWHMGYQLKYGLYHVNMADENRTRTPKKSAFVYKEIIRSRVIDYDYDPNPYAYNLGFIAKEESAYLISTAIKPSSTVFLLFSVALFNLF